MKPQSTITLLLLCISLALPSQSSAYVGGQSDLFYGASGGRPTAMGGAYIALSDDSVGFNYNPAGIAFITQHHINFSYSLRFTEGSDFQEFSYAGPVSPIINLGASLERLSFGEVEWRNPSGKLVGSYTSSNIRFSFGGARAFFGIFSLGGKVSYEKFSAADQEDSHPDISIGFQLRPGADPEEGRRGNFCLAGVLYGTNPLQGSFGASFTYDIATLSGQVDAITEGTYHLRFGGELSLIDSFAIRAGLDDSSPTFGIGVKTGGISIDYSYAYKELGTIHTATLGFVFGPDLTSIALRKKRIKLLLQEGKYHLQVKNYTLAIERFENVLSWDEENYEARELLQKARLEMLLEERGGLLEVGEYERALELLHQAKDLDPQNKRIDGHIEATLEAIRKREWTYIEQERVWELYAQASEQIRRLNLYRAVGILEEILELDPDNSFIKDRLKELRLKIASVAVVPMVEITADIISTYEAGVAAIDAGRLNEGISLLEGVYSQVGGYESTVSKLNDGYFYLGMDSYSRGRLREAIGYWQRILALDPGDAQAVKLIDKAQKELAGME